MYSGLRISILNTLVITVEEESVQSNSYAYALSGTLMSLQTDTITKKYYYSYTLKIFAIQLWMLCPVKRFPFFSSIISPSRHWYFAPKIGTNSSEIHEIKYSSQAAANYYKSLQAHHIIIRSCPIIARSEHYYCPFATKCIEFDFAQCVRIRSGIGFPIQNRTTTYAFV